MAAHKTILDIVLEYCTNRECDVFYYSGAITPGAGRGFIDKILAKQSHSKNISLFLATYGGDPHTAFRIVRVLKKHYREGKIRLLIDGPCKSAGTLLSLGVDELAIGPRGELGPLDTQLSKQDELVFMNSGLDILQALSLVTSNAFDSCISNILEIVRRSGGSISTKTASEIATGLTAGVFQPITAQIDPFRLGEAHRSMRIAREYGERLKSNLLKPGMLERLVQDYPSHGFVIDKDEAEKYFTQVDDFSSDELQIADFLGDDVRLPKEDPESFDLSAFMQNLASKSPSNVSLHASDSHVDGSANQPLENAGEDLQEIGNVNADAQSGTSSYSDGEGHGSGTQTHE